MKQSDSKPIRVPTAIYALGSAVFFVNLSSVMVRCLTAAYMRTLGVGIFHIGLIEGIVEALSFVMKMMSGVVSDYLRRRKLIVIIGYVLTMIARPIIGVFGNVQAVVLARTIDRIGNGIQASPRDALVGDIAPPTIRGACYGLRVGLGTAGSFMGALTALVLMYWNDSDYQHVFLMATIPALIAVLIMIFFVREPEKNLHPVDHKPRHPLHWSDVPRLGKPFWLLMIVVAVFMIAQLGEAIMVLHAHKNFGLSDKNVPLILLIYNATYSTGSYPAGMLSDRFGRNVVLRIGFLSLIFGDLLLASASGLHMVFIGIALCGLQMAITQSIFMAMVTDSVPEDLRGTGFGVFYLICALSALISNAVGGHIAEVASESSSFLASMIVASIAFLFLLCFGSCKKEKGETPQTC